MYNCYKLLLVLFCIGLTQQFSEEKQREIWLQKRSVLQNDTEPEPEPSPVSEPSQESEPEPIHQEPEPSHSPQPAPYNNTCYPCPEGHHSIAQCTVPAYPNVTLECDWMSGECLPDGQGKDTCVPCNGGTFADSPRSRDCSPCSAGFYCPPASVKEILCPEGCFCRAGDAEPRPCFAGYECQAKGLTEGIPCNPGFYCTGGNEPAKACGENFYCDKIACSQCQPCMQPWQNSAGAATNCSLAPLSIVLIALSVVILGLVVILIWTVRKKRMNQIDEYDISTETLVPRAEGPKYGGF